MMSRWYHRLSPWVHTTPPGRSARCMASKKGCRGGGAGVCVGGGEGMRSGWGCREGMQVGHQRGRGCSRHCLPPHPQGAQALGLPCALLLHSLAHLLEQYLGGPDRVGGVDDDDVVVALGRILHKLDAVAHVHLRRWWWRWRRWQWRKGEGENRPVIHVELGRTGQRQRG